MLIVSPAQSNVHDDITFLTAIKHMTVEQIIEMGSERRKKIINEILIVVRWMNGIEKLATDIENERE